MSPEPVPFNDADDDLSVILSESDPYTDPSFTTATRFDFSRLNRVRLHWRRPVQLSSNPLLFGDFIHPSLIRQGRIGNCFFIAALSLLCSYPDDIRRLFLTPDLNPQGAYCLQFFRNGEWENVMIDDQLPTCKQKGGDYRLILGRSTRSDIFWVSIIEKAYAKFYRSYAAISGGNISEALVDLTAAPVQDYNIRASGFKSRAFFLGLMADIDQGALVGCAMCCQDPEQQVEIASNSDDSDDDERADGIQINHAYSIVKVVKAMIDGSDRRMLLIKNPQGAGSRSVYTGRYSNPDLWSDQAKSVLGTGSISHGLFWATWKEFRDQFNRVYVCRRDISSTCSRGAISGSWTTSGGCSNYASWRSNPTYRLDDDVRALTLQQPDRRLLSGTGPISYPMIGITIIALDMRLPNGFEIPLMSCCWFSCPIPEDNPFLSSSSGRYTIYGRTSFWNKRDISIVIPSDWPRPLVAVPSFHDPGLTGDFILNTYSTDGSGVRARDYSLIELEFDGEWDQTSSGGGLLSPTFNANPKYLISLDGQQHQLPEQITLFIGLRQLRADRDAIGINVVRKGAYALKALSGDEYHGLDRSWFIDQAVYSPNEEVNRVVVLARDQFPYLIIPSTNQSQRPGRYTLYIYARRQEIFSSRTLIIDKSP